MQGRQRDGEGPGTIRGQTDAQETPRFAGWTTFARLPRLEDVSDYQVAVAGVRGVGQGPA